MAGQAKAQTAGLGPQHGLIGAIDQRVDFAVHLGQQAAEFAATMAADMVITADGLRQPGPSHLQQRVARRMAKAVVDGLEPCVRACSIW